MRRPTRLATGALGFLAAASLIVAVPAMPALGLSPTQCKVKDIESGVTKTSLQAAVRAAKGGDHLTVRGVCHGTTLIAKNLSIAGIRPAGAAKPALDGDAAGTVVTIAFGNKVSIRKLLITDGAGSTGAGGVDNRGKLTLTGVAVRYNADTGILSQPGTTLILNGASSVDHNTAMANGGGINSAGTVILNDSSSVHHNTASLGGGFINGSLSTFTLNDSSSVHDNTAGDGAGAWNEGTITIGPSASIHHNTATTSGGGVIEYCGTLSGSYCGTLIHDNSPDDCKDYFTASRRID